MSVGWESLPLIPLRCVLDHLNLEDALSTLSVCRHWRNAMLLYEGHKEVLKLVARQPERNMFLSRVFRRHVRKLHVYLDCDGDEADKLFSIVLPEFYDTLKLKEILFIGPSYMQQNFSQPAIKLKRVITESLIFKHSHCLIKFAMFGCEMDVANDNDRYMHERVEYYSSPLVFDERPSSADSVLSQTNHGLMVFCNLQHISVDYEQIDTKSLETLSHLPMFNHLTMNICNKNHLLYTPIDWRRLEPAYPNGIDVSVNIIGLNWRRFDDVMENVLVEGMSLVALRVFFCKTLYPPLLDHVARYYSSTLRALVWVDSVLPTVNPIERIIQHKQTQSEQCNINPFILLCWKCVNLQKLVIHGYWIWEYDILGFVRLCKTLQHLDISAIYNKQSRFDAWAEVQPDTAIRVLATDTPTRQHPAYVQKVNSLTSFQWKPRPWSSLHPALTARSSAAQRNDYILQEINQTETTM